MQSTNIWSCLPLQIKRKNQDLGASESVDYTTWDPLEHAIIHCTKNEGFIQ